jgi:hypothetical protein
MKINPVTQWTSKPQPEIAPRFDYSALTAHAHFVALAPGTPSTRHAAAQSTRLALNTRLENKNTQGGFSRLPSVARKHPVTRNRIPDFLDGSRKPPHNSAQIVAVCPRPHNSAQAHSSAQVFLPAASYGCTENTCKHSREALQGRQ